MTIREYLNKKKRKCFSIFFTAIGIYGFSLALFDYIDNMYIIATVGLCSFVIIVVCFWYAYFKICCPICKNSLGCIVFAHNKKASSILDKVKHCPFCGVDIDITLDKTP